MTLVRTTLPDDATARTVARRLVDEKLAACVHRIPVQSTYSWSGQVREEDEVILEARTLGAKAAALRKRLLALHPYEVPVVEMWDVHGVPPSYLDWAAGHGA